jgi:hypothetical protein
VAAIVTQPLEALSTDSGSSGCMLSKHIKEAWLKGQERITHNVIYHGFLPSFLENMYLMTFYSSLLKHPSIRSIFVFGNRVHQNATNLPNQGVLAEAGR